MNKAARTSAALESRWAPQRMVLFKEWLMDRSKPWSATFRVCFGLQPHFCGFSDGRCLQRTEAPLMRLRATNFPLYTWGFSSYLSHPCYTVGAPWLSHLCPTCKVSCQLLSPPLPSHPPGSGEGDMIVSKAIHLGPCTNPRPCPTLTSTSCLVS